MFTEEVDCTYFFTWDTKHACVKEKEDLLCGLTDGKRRYDLSALARHAGRPPVPAWVSAETFSCLFPHEYVWKCCCCFCCQLTAAWPLLRPLLGCPALST